MAFRCLVPSSSSMSPGTITMMEASSTTTTLPVTPSKSIMSPASVTMIPGTQLGSNGSVLSVSRLCHIRYALTNGTIMPCEKSGDFHVDSRSGTVGAYKAAKAANMSASLIKSDLWRSAVYGTHILSFISFIKPHSKG